MQERFFRQKSNEKREKRLERKERIWFISSQKLQHQINNSVILCNKQESSNTRIAVTNQRDGRKKKRRSHVVRGTFFPLQLTCGRVRFLFKQDFRINISKEQCGKHWQLFCRTRQSSYLWILPRGRPFVHSLPWGTDLPTAHPPDEDHLKRKWNH